MGSLGIPRISERFAILFLGLPFRIARACVWDPPGSLGFAKDLHPSLGPSFSLRPCLCVGSPGIPKIPKGFGRVARVCVWDTRDPLDFPTIRPSIGVGLGRDHVT